MNGQILYNAGGVIITQPGTGNIPYGGTMMNTMVPVTAQTEMPDPAAVNARSFANAQVMTPDGFKPLSKEERNEAARIALEAGFSFDGYQVVRREFFSHKYDPTLTIKGSSIIFNNACISKLDEVVYIQVLINPDTEKLVIRPCNEGAKDAVRWCIAKDEKRKSREISCGLFTAKLYEMMGWEQLYRYKLQGSRIVYQGEQLYIFDLTSTEVFLPQVKEGTGANAKSGSRKAVYPESWRDSFGIPVHVHAESTQIDLSEGYNAADFDGKFEGYVEKEAMSK